MTTEHRGTAGTDTTQWSLSPEDHDLIAAPGNEVTAQSPTKASTEGESVPDPVDHLVRRPIFRPFVATLWPLVVVLVGAVAIRWLWSTDFRNPWRIFAYVVVCLALAVGVLVIIAGISLRHRGRSVLGEVLTEAGIALVAGAVVGLVLLPIDEDRFDREQIREERRADHQEQLEEDRNELEARRDDIRFVREVVIEGASIKSFVGFDLTDARLAGLDLTGADLTDADLHHTDLRLATLAGADLTGANLTDVNVRHADLSGADLTGANLARADLTGANLARADLTGVDVPGIDFPVVDPKVFDPNLYDLNPIEPANLTDATLRGANLTDATLAGADLSGADLSDATLTGATLGDVNLTGANLSGVDLSGVDLASANVTGARYDETTTWPEDSGAPK